MIEREPTIFSFSHKKAINHSIKLLFYFHLCVWCECQRTKSIYISLRPLFQSSFHEKTNTLLLLLLLLYHILANTVYLHFFSRAIKVDTCIQIDSVLKNYSKLGFKGAEENHLILYMEGNETKSYYIPQN